MGHWKDFRFGFAVAGVLVLTIATSAATADRSNVAEMKPQLASQDADPEWLTVAASGTVETRPASLEDDSWNRVRRGDGVPALSVLRTSQKGRATLTRHGDVILVSPDSELTLPQIPESDTTTVRQNSGKALYQVSPRSSGKFTVETPYLVAGVKGTEFSIVVEGKTIAVDVVEGHVHLENPVTGEAMDLFEGQTVLQQGPDGRFLLHHEGDGDVAVDKTTLKQLRKVRQDTRKLLRIASFDAMSIDDIGGDILSENQQDDGQRESLMLNLRDYKASLAEEKQAVTDEEATRKSYILDFLPADDPRLADDDDDDGS